MQPAGIWRVAEFRVSSRRHTAHTGTVSQACYIHMLCFPFHEEHATNGVVLARMHKKERGERVVGRAGG